MNLKVWFVLVFAIFVAASSARAQEAPEVRLFDTGSAASTPYNPFKLSDDTWTRIPEDKTDYVFRGDAWLMNDKISVVFRRKSGAAEVNAYKAGIGPILCARLIPLAGSPATRLTGIKIIDNTAGEISLDVTYKTGLFDSLTVNYNLKVGQPFVQTQSKKNATALNIVAPCRFAVLPDFFADDIVVDATAINADETELPSDNFLMHMTPGAIVLAVWDKAQDDIAVKLSGEGAARQIAGSVIQFLSDEKGPGKISVAVLEGPNMWHARNIAKADGDKEIKLDWTAPFQAQWRVDWQTTDKVTDSWEMLTQKADGSYEKHGWYGQAENFGNDTWLKAGRQRWTTVLGRFKYPCWLDKDGSAYIRPLVNKALTFQGPAIVYPINRIDSTPLEAFTVMDMMRATLGVGPCEYILDIAGQKKSYTGLPTCETQTALMAIYTAREQVKKHDEVVKLLTDVIAFVRQIRGRIEQYREFGVQMDQYLESRKTAYPQYAGTIAELQKINRGIEEHYKLKTNMNTPEYATGLYEEFRTKLVDYEGPDAVDKCKKITDALRFIGADQDELVGECRVQVKILRQRAAMAMAADPKFASIAKEIRQRTQQMLRNPLSYEAPRH